MTGAGRFDADTTAFAILRTIVDLKATNLYKLSKKMKIPSSKVSYHLPSLLEAGLILFDDDSGTYIPQPILVNPEFISVVEKAMDDIYQVAGNNPSEVYVKSGKIEDLEAALENCIRARVSLSLSPQ